MTAGEFVECEARDDLLDAIYRVRTTLDIYSHAMRGKDAAAARVWDAIQERDRTERPKSVN